jgi:hypothetical protein
MNTSSRSLNISVCTEVVIEAVGPALIFNLTFSFSLGYTILDNDWSSAEFIPFLLAADAGIEILALTSCTFPSCLISHDTPADDVRSYF